MRIGVLAAVVFALLAGPAAQSPAPRPELALGLIRPDGILTPVALLDAGAWIDPWPEVNDDIRLNRMIEAVPSYWRDRRRIVPQAWLVATGHPSQLTAVKVLTHVVHGEHCGNQVGLLTDLQRADGDTHDKRLAMTHPAPFALPVSVEAGAGDWKDLVARVHEEVARQETAAIAREEEHAGRRSELASGWIHARDGSRPAVLDGRAVITGIDYKEALTITPLAILTLDGAAVWAVTEHGYESEAFSLIDVGAEAQKRFCHRL